jgi:hypothetical protein
MTLLPASAADEPPQVAAEITRPRQRQPVPPSRDEQQYEPRTFRLGREEIEILETVRVNRRRSRRPTRGRADYSALVREAIRAYFQGSRLS